MKNKLLIITLNIFILINLVSCNNKKAEFEYKNYTTVYAYNIELNIIEEVEIEYEINDYIDVFNLYTKHQNNLPIGYTSSSSACISLKSSYVKNNIVYYEVDDYIFLSKDYTTFLSLLKKENRNLGYINTKIINNDNILS